MFRFIFLMTLLIIFLIFGLTKNLYSDEILSQEISAPTNYVKQPFDVLSYNATLDLSSYPSTYVEGKCDILVFWSGSLSDEKFYFHLRDLIIDSVFYNTKPIQCSEIGTKEDPTYHYEIDGLERTMNPSTISIYYHGYMTVELNNQSMKWGGVQYKDSVLFAMGVGFYNNYVSTTQHWLPCYDLPSDKAKFKCKFIVPKGLYAASNGLMTNFENLDNKTDAITWEHNNDCATYNYTFAVGPYNEINLGTDELPMPVYSLAQDTNSTKIVFKLLPKMVETYKLRFGAYPFEKVGYVLTPIGSMEHETLISFSNKLVRMSTDTINETGAHELAHMWFGDMVTPYDFRDAWLNESFASWCESIWYEELFNFQRALTHLDNMRNYYILGSNGSRYEGVFPLYNFPRTPPSSNYPLTIYYKGAVVVGMLRYELGDSLFFLSLKNYLDSSKYGNATTNQLQSIFENTTGKDLDWFFNQWIYGAGWPQINVNLIHTGSNYKIKLTQVQPFDTWGIFENLPIEIGFNDANGNVTYKLFKMDEIEQEFDMDIDFIVSSINVNKGPTLRSLLEVKSITTGINDIDYAKVNLYPNPTDSQIVVVFNAGNGIANVKIYDIQGNVVLLNNLNTRKGSNQYIIDTSFLQNGNYYLLIETDISTVREKFLVTH